MFMLMSFLAIILNNKQNFLNSTQLDFFVLKHQQNTKTCHDPLYQALGGTQKARSWWAGGLEKDDVLP